MPVEGGGGDPEHPAGRAGAHEGAEFFHCAFQHHSVGSVGFAPLGP